MHGEPWQCHILVQSVKSLRHPRNRIVCPTIGDKPPPWPPVQDMRFGQTCPEPAIPQTGKDQSTERTMHPGEYNPLSVCVLQQTHSAHY